MAETYETSIYKTQPAAPGQGAQGQTQTGAAPPPTGGEQYETPIYKTQQTAPAAAPKPPVAPSTPQPATTGGGNQPSGWGISGWSGNVTMPQSAQDWSTLATQNSLMGLYPGLTAQAEAARKRMDPLTAASADVAGGTISPSSLLNAVPVVGPELAGGLHEGVKSAVTNWTPDESWPTYLKNVGEDTAGGVAAGFAGQMGGLGVAKALPELIKGGVTGGTAYLGHKMLGGWSGGDLLKEAPGLLGVYKGMDSVANWAGEKGKDLISSPAAQQAIKNLVLGAGSAFRQGTGPYDRWIPGQ